MSDAPLEPDLAQRIASVAIDSVGREFPNQIAHSMVSAAESGTPRSLHPAFYGCYDWHSAVHSHWCLARLLRLNGEGSAWERVAREALSRALTTENIAAEADYLTPDHRRTFERPYGIAWLLALDTELARSDQTDSWRSPLEPLTALCADRLLAWTQSLTHPVRTGVHSQSAFAMSLAIDHASATDDGEQLRALSEEARRLHAHDEPWSLAHEPSGEDFLSPSLCAADLMRRVLSPTEFSEWISRVLPDLASTDLTTRLPVARPSRARDGRLAHLHGLNLSRAWALAAIAAALPADDDRSFPLHALAADHARAGVEGLDDDDYHRAHWLGTFAVYYLSGCGASAG